MNQQEREEFGAYLRSLRTEKGLSRRQVASKVGWSESFIGKLECGVVMVGLNGLERLAPILEASVDDLVSKAGFTENDDWYSAMEAASEVAQKYIKLAKSGVWSDPLPTAEYREEVPAGQERTFENRLQTGIYNYYHDHELTVRVEFEGGIAYVWVGPPAGIDSRID